MDYMEEDGNNASNAQNTSLQITGEQFSEVKVTYSNIPNARDQEMFSVVSSLKRQNSDLSDNKVYKKQRTEVYLSKIGDNKNEDIDDTASCTQIKTSMAHVYDTMAIDDIFSIAEQNTIIQESGHTKLFESTAGETNPIGSFGDETSNEILPYVVNGVRFSTINGETQNEEKEHDTKAISTGDNDSKKTGEIIEIDEDFDWLNQTLSKNSIQENLGNLAEETGMQESAEPSLNVEQMAISRSLNESFKLEDQDIILNGSMVKDEGNSEPSLNIEKIVFSRSLSELIKLDYEILSTESKLKGSDIPVDLLEDVPPKDTFPCILNELTKLKDREILPTMPVVKDPGISVDLLEAKPSNGSIHFYAGEKDKNGNIDKDLVSDCIKQTLLNKSVQLCTQNNLPVEISTSNEVESNEVSNKLEKNSVQQEYDVFNNLSDLQKNTNIFIIKSFLYNSPLEKYKNENNTIEEIQAQSHLKDIFESPRAENLKQNVNATQNVNNFLNSPFLGALSFLNKDDIEYPKISRHIAKQDKSNFLSKDQDEDKYKYTKLFLDNVSLYNKKYTSIKTPDLNSEKHTNEVQICSENELIPIKCNNFGNIQEKQSFNSNYNTSTSNKKLNIDSKEIKNILSLESGSSEISHEIETSFDIKKDLGVMEIDFCISTVVTNDQQAKLDQNKDAIDINVYEENISIKGKSHKIEINDNTLSLYSTGNIADLDRSTSSVPIIIKTINSRKDSNNLAKEVSIGYEDSLFQPYKEMANGEQLASSNGGDKSANKCEELLSTTVLVGQNCDNEEGYFSNEENMKYKDNNEKSTEFLNENENIANDSDKDSDIFPQQCEETFSTSHSSGKSNLNDFSVKRSLLSPCTLGKKFPRYSSKSSALIPDSNLIHEVFLAFLENQVGQGFTIQEVVNFIMEESNDRISYFDAIHSIRTFLKNALNAEMLKMNNGKYIIKSSVDIIT